MHHSGNNGASVATTADASSPCCLTMAACFRTKYAQTCADPSYPSNFPLAQGRILLFAARAPDGNGSAVRDIDLTYEEPLGILSYAVLAAISDDMATTANEMI